MFKLFKVFVIVAFIVGCVGMINGVIKGDYSSALDSALIMWVATIEVAVVSHIKDIKALDVKIKRLESKND